MLNENEFRGIYNDYLESGLTIRDYCSNQHMGEAKFYYWQRRLKGMLGSITFGMGRGFWHSLPRSISY